MSPVWAYIRGRLRGAKGATRTAPVRDARGNATELDRLKDLLIEFEGMRLKSYKCPAGKWTIGVGATRTLGCRPVPEGMSISKAQADALLDRDAGAALDSAISMLNDDATPGARIAFASLVFNFGARRIKKSQAVLCYNEGDTRQAEKEFKEWRGIRYPDGSFKVLPGLVRRRRAEWALVERDMD